MISISLPFINISYIQYALMIFLICKLQISKRKFRDWSFSKFVQAFTNEVVAIYFNLWAECETRHVSLHAMKRAEILIGREGKEELEILKTKTLRGTKILFCGCTCLGIVFFFTIQSCQFLINTLTDADFFRSMPPAPRFRCGSFQAEHPGQYQTFSFNTLRYDEHTLP